MPTRIPRTHGRRCQITPRDIALFEAIDRHPFTTDQLLQLSCTFAEPFTQERLLRRRLQQLREAGLLQGWPLATVGHGGAPHYWKLTRPGYQWLQGDEVILPSRRYFEAIAPGHHHHTRCLGEFLVRTYVAAHQRGIAVRYFARENSVQLQAGGFTVVPDCAFQLHTPAGRVFHFCVELDNGTERVRSRLDVESIERKLRGYDAHQSQFAALDPQRYLVLFVTTRSSDRLTHILDLAAQVMRNPQRTVFVGISLDTYLKCADPFREAVLIDHRGLKRTLISVVRENKSAQLPSSFT
jgi:protein involved in plasmid replication-relaxation